MTLIQLRYLVAIVDAKLNIGVAATRVNATQPGISKQLKQIEDELGFQVFIRKGKRLESTTDGGGAVIERARVILAEIENIRAVAANHVNQTRGQLRIATTQTQIRFVLPPALSRLKARYPDVSARLTPASEPEALAMLDRDQADLAIVSTIGARPSGEIALPLYRWQRMLITPRNHPLTVLTRPLTLADLAVTPLVTYESALQPDSSVSQAFQAKKLTPNFACTTRDADTIKTCVRSGLGVGIVAEMALGPVDVDLIQRPADDLFATCTTWLVLRRDRVHRNYLFELLGVLAPHLARDQIHAALHGAFDEALPAQAPAWRTIAQQWTTSEAAPHRLKARLVVVHPDETAANAA